MNKGLVHVYTGHGKGKTTAALGLAIRAAGHGMRAAFVQFLKGRVCGEHFFTSQYHPFDIIQLGTDSNFTAPVEKQRLEVRKTLIYTGELMQSGHYDLLILDEVFIAICKGLITTEQVLDLMDKKPEPVELILTGRYAPPEIIQRADLVTEMLMVKHPFQKGIAARIGIEY